MKSLRLLQPRWLLFGLLAAVALGMAACGDEGEEEPVAETAPPIKIGVVYDASGAVTSPLGLSYVKGAEIAIDDINAQGGIKVGGQTYRLEYVKVDSRSDPVAAIAGAQQLLQDRVVAVAVGTCAFAPQVYAQIKPTANTFVWTVCPPLLNLLDKNVPAFYEGLEKNPLLFSAVDFTLPIIKGWLAQITAIHPDIKKVSFLLDNGPLGRALVPTLEIASKDLGLEFVGGDQYPLGTTDFSTYATNVKARNPDIVYMTSGTVAFDVPVAAVELDIAPYIIVSGLRPSDVPSLGDFGDMVVIATDFRLPYHKGIEPPEYTDEVAKFGELPGGLPLQIGFAVAWYDFIQLLAQAMEKAGTVTDADAIAQAFVGQSRESIMGGKVTVDPDHATRGSMGNFEVTRDKFTVYIYTDATSSKPIDKYDVPRR